jgi:hypothetical protein
VVLGLKGKLKVFVGVMEQVATGRIEELKLSPALRCPYSGGCFHSEETLKFKLGLAASSLVTME